MKKINIMKEFNVCVFNENTNKFEKYNVMPYFINCWKESKKGKNYTKDFIKEFIIKNSMYMYWSRCQWEIIISDWPCQQIQEKIDVHQQIMMNIEIVIDLFIENIKTI
jgi:hypothetical protein